MKKKRKAHVIHICDHRSIPGATECLEAVWSQGRSCKTCYRDDCYRQGWGKRQVDFDNNRLVQRNLARLARRAK